MAQLFKNNAAGAISGSISDSATTITLATGHGARFPSVGSDYFLATLVGVDGNGLENAWEIVKVTARSNDVLTVVRAQEGTTAAIWGSGTRIESRATAATFGSFLVATGVTPGTYSKLTVLASGLISAGEQLASGDITTALGFTPENAANKNVANGYVGLDSNTLISSVFLPSYVDDVIEVANFAALPGTGETGKIYTTIDNKKIFRWGGSSYTEISPSPGSTDEVTEGASNLYFTTARARTSVSASGSISYDNTTGVFSYTAPTNISAFTNDVGYITSTALNGYITAATVAATYLPLVGGSISGNLTFNGTGARIIGDFSNSTVANRTMFQTSTVNGTTQVGILPNGTSVNAQLHLFGASDPTNAPYGGLVINSTAIRVFSAALGSGTALPLTFYMGSTEYARLSTGGNWLLGTTTDDGVNKLQVVGTASATNYTTPATTGTTPTYGSDLLAGIGAFVDATGWTLGSGWSITGGQAVYTSGGGTLSATIAVVSGTKYQIDWTHVSGTYNATFTAGAVSTMAAPYWGNKSLTFVAGTTGSVTLSIAMSSAATIDALTVKAVTTAGRAVSYQSLDASGSVAGEYSISARSLFNTATGVNALLSNTTGYNNTANGRGALLSNTTGHSNTANGTSALQLNTTGYQNTANGASALQLNTTGHSNTANGTSALLSNTTGYSNTANGTNALYSNTTGDNNTANGTSALYSNTTGYQNTANGASALYSNTTGYQNTANGASALYDVRPTSKAITAFSDYSGSVAGTVKATSAAHGLTGTTTKQITGTVNYNGSKSVTVIDADSFYFTATWVATETGWWSVSTEGNSNTAIGFNTGRGISTGTGNTILGANVTGLAAGLTNNIILANGTGAIKAQHDGSNWTFTGGVNLDKTVTAAATTGAQTINKTTGSVNFAAAATSLVVTNSLVTANSIIICTVATNDTTLKSVCAVAGAGSFTLTANAAATAETRVNFLVIN